MTLGQRGSASRARKTPMPLSLARQSAASPEEAPRRRGGYWGKERPRRLTDSEVGPYQGKLRSKCTEPPLASSVSHISTTAPFNQSSKEPRQHDVSQEPN